MTLLRGTGERLDSRTAERKLTRSGRTPEQALTILAGAREQAADLQAKGEKVKVVGYALSALDGWGKVFLRPEQAAEAEPPAHESPTPNEEAQVAAELLVAKKICSTAQDARAEVERIAGPILQEGPVAAVEIALHAAKKRAASGQVESFGGLVRHFLRGAPAPEIPRLLRQWRWHREAERSLRPEVETHNSGASWQAAWAKVAEPLRSDPQARLAFEEWQRVRGLAPSPDSPGYLDHFDSERQAQRALVALAEAALGARAEAVRAELAEGLAKSGIQEGTVVWKRAWEHHWSRKISEAWGLPC